MKKYIVQVTKAGMTTVYSCVYGTVTCQNYMLWYHTAV